MEVLTQGVEQLGKKFMSMLPGYLLDHNDIPVINMADMTGDMNPHMQGTNPFPFSMGKKSSPFSFSGGRVAPRSQRTGKFGQANANQYNGKFFTAAVARQFSKFALETMPGVRRNSTRAHGVGRVRRGQSQFDQGSTFFSKRFRTGNGGFDGSSAQQLVNRSRTNRAQRGVIDPVMKKSIPEDESKKQTQLLREILVVQKATKDALAKKDSEASVARMATILADKKDPAANVDGVK